MLANQNDSQSMKAGSYSSLSGVDNVNVFDPSLNTINYFKMEDLTSEIAK